jgi:Icc-related predicted phosphoesterase
MAHHCLFVSDLHGKVDRYEKLFAAIATERPRAVFVGGDILPHGFGGGEYAARGGGSFLTDFFIKRLEKLRDELGEAYPTVFLILGNDDPRSEEEAVVDASDTGILVYAHNNRHKLGEYEVFGYAYIPPTPFWLKDWERYDVSRYVDPGCVPPYEGVVTFPVSEHVRSWATISADLNDLVGDSDLDKAVFLFHSPPYKTALDRAALDGQMVDHVPVDVHVGSIAIMRLIEERQPLLTLHGHVHESTRMTGMWRQRIGRTLALNGAHDGSELALVRFDLGDLENVTRELV